MDSIADWLRSAGAQHDVVEWAEPFGNDWQRLWEDCPRGDWMLGVAARLEVDRAQLVAAACKCARLGLLYLDSEQAALAECLEAVESGVATDAGTNAWRRAHENAVQGAAQAADPAMASAAQAVVAALESVQMPESAAHAAACVIQAAVLDAGDCGMMAALRFTQGRCAQLVREAVPTEAITRCAATLGELEPAR